jgi:hypothetical protein
VVELFTSVGKNVGSFQQLLKLATTNDALPLIAPQDLIAKFLLPTARVDSPQNLLPLVHH